ncbi:hypothetical protein [Paenibacillus crassostreae]|uniref:Uncharacterized protein n=1 Tax=Paenibacillus crassostreae TaxID=1763538 RepID=A0A167AUG5_9BACL|nr:hypothetical protein [Paenibacillus crassostreae]AOZ93614.1 hypothetical protein LPB68_16395 [Paenibacillus crassostreae]OAB71441.1 hypothetical protein PNBC_19265 [Paenibacillus crassostreae]
MKKSIVRIRQIKLSKSNIGISNGKFIITQQEPVLIQQSENLYYHTLFRLLNKPFPPQYDNRNDYTTDAFILTGEMIEDNERDNNPAKRKSFAEIIEKGIWIADIHYLRSICSVSMKRSQRTLFVRADLRDHLDEYLSLGKNKQIKQTIISKYLASIGLCLSSANIVENKPRICVIEDAIKPVTENVLQVRNYRKTENEAEENERIQQLMIQQDIQQEQNKLAKAEAKERLSQDALAKLPKSQFQFHKAHGKWFDENRYVRAEDILKPVAHTLFQGIYYPAYELSQTEERIQIPLTPYSVGKELAAMKDYSHDTNLFDGMGLCSIEWATKISKALKLDYVPSAFQYRDLMQKGLLLKMDFKAYFAKHGITAIPDLWGKPHTIKEIDLILTASQFKMFLEKEKDDDKLFSSIQEYDDLKDHYGFKHIAIAAVSKQMVDTNPYIQTAYQHIQAFALTPKELNRLVLPTSKLARELVKGQNISFIKAYLGMYPHEEESDYELRDYFAEALDIHDGMLDDPHMRKWLAGRAQDIVKDVYQGKFYVRGFTNPIAVDPIAFMEWAMYRDVDKIVGFLHKGEFYAKGREGRFVGIRNPIVHYSETLKMEFVESDHKWIKDIDGVVLFNAHSLAALRIGGADFDWDQISVYDNEILLWNIINSDVIIPCSDEAPKTKEKPLKIQSIIEYELFSLSNETGKITNIGTTFANRSCEHNNGDPSQYSFECAVSKILQGDVIDSQKSEVPVVIPKILKQEARLKPYFMINIDFGDKRNYQKREWAESPLNQLVIRAENWMKKVFSEDGDVLKDEIEGYVNPSRQTYRLLQDKTMCDTATFNRIITELKPVYDDWMSEKENIDATYDPSQAIGKDQRKEVGKQRRKAYSLLNEEIRKRGLEIYAEPSVLASCAAQISYILTKSEISGNSYARNDNYGFCWTVCPSGIIANMRVHENYSKQDILEVSSLNHLRRDFGGKRLAVQDGLGVVDGEEVKVVLPDGIYKIRSVIGKHFIEIDVEREANVVYAFNKISNKPELKLKPIRAHYVKLLKINPDMSPVQLFDVIEELDMHLQNNTKGYLALFDQTERYLGSIASEYVTGGSGEEAYDLEQYIGTKVTIAEKIMSYSKSIAIKINIS